MIPLLTRVVINCWHFVLLSYFRVIFLVTKLITILSTLVSCKCLLLRNNSCRSGAKKEFKSSCEVCAVNIFEIPTVPANVFISSWGKYCKIRSKFCFCFCFTKKNCQKNAKIREKRMLTIYVKFIYYFISQVFFFAWTFSNFLPPMFYSFR